MEEALVMERVVGRVGMKGCGGDGEDVCIAGGGRGSAKVTRRG